LFVAVVFAPSQAVASFSGSPSKLLPVIPSPDQTQVVDVPAFTLEIGHGLFCGNDPVNRHDPLGLVDQFNAGDPLTALLMGVNDPYGYIPAGEGFVFLTGQDSPFGSNQNPYADRYRAMAMGQAMATSAALWGNAGIASLKMGGGVVGMAASGFLEGGSWGLSSPLALPAFAGSTALFFSGARQFVTGDSVTFSGQLTKLGADPDAAAELEFMMDGSMMLAPGGLFIAESVPARNIVTGRNSNWLGRQRFDPSDLSPTQIDNAILKSIRRKSGATGTSTGQIAATNDQVEFILKKATYWRRNVHAADEELALLPANQKGTILHSSVAKKMRQLNIEGLLVNQRLYGISQFVSPATGLPYAFRIPDYRIGPTILDLKPVGTSLSGPQVIDFMNFGNTNDVRFIFYQPW
jgi:hypothetical protein